MSPSGGSLLDPTGSDALVAAAGWVRDAVTGTAATSVMTIAVAGLGMLLLQGHVPMRRAASVVLGCFVILGAAPIAGALLSAARGASGEVTTSEAPFIDVGPPPDTPRPSKPPPYDPYAGASVPIL